MDAIGEFLGFEGRIDRRGYVWRSIAAVALILGLSAGGGSALFFAVRPRGEADYEACAQALAAGIVLLSLWAGSALASRRMRDMGLEPAHFVPLYAALWVANVVLLQPLSLQQPTTFAPLEGGWMLLHLLAGMTLLLWPGRDPALRQPQFEPAQATSYVNWRESA